MDDLVAFLLARLDERAAKAQAAMCGSEGRWSQVDPDREPGRIEDDRGEPVSYYEGSPTVEQADHIAANDPAYVLCEVEAKRLLLDEFAHYAPGDDGYPEFHTAVRLLALPDADHPDYQQEWKP
jgi:hypothetical protein